MFVTEEETNIFFFLIYYQTKGIELKSLTHLFEKQKQNKIIKHFVKKIKNRKLIYIKMFKHTQVILVTK